MWGWSIAAGIIAMVIEFAIMCFRSVSRKVPTNYILLTVFTLLKAFLFSYIGSFYDPSSCISAAILTATATISLTIYAFHTKRDFTACGQVLCLLCTVACVLCILSMFLSFTSPLKPLLAGFFVILYGLFLVFHT